MAWECGVLETDDAADQIRRIPISNAMGLGAPYSYQVGHWWRNEVGPCEGAQCGTAAFELRSMQHSSAAAGTAHCQVWIFFRVVVSLVCPYGRIDRGDKGATSIRPWELT